VPTALATIQQQLAGVSRHWWRVRLTEQLAAIASALAVIVLSAVALLGFWIDQPPMWLRWTATLAAVVTFLLISIRALFVLLRRLRPGQAARLVEQAYPFLGNGPINAILFATGDAEQDELTHRAITETASQLTPLNLRPAVSTRRRNRRLVIAGALWVILFGLLLFTPGILSRSVEMLFRPSQYAPHRHSLSIAHLSPGDTIVHVGQTVTMRIEIADGTPDDYGPVTVVIEGDNAPIPMEYTPDIGHTYTTPPLAEPLRYAIRVGRRHYPVDRPWFRVDVVDRWALEAFSATMTFPDYLQRPPAEIAEFPGSMSVPQYTQVELRVRMTPMPPGLAIEFPDGRLQPMTSINDTFIGTFVADETQEYRLLVIDEADGPVWALPQPTAGEPSPWFTLTAQPDAPPTVTILEPGQPVTLAPRESLPLRLRATDDHGLGELIIYAGKDDFPVTAITQISLNRSTVATIHPLLDLDQLGPYQPGDVVSYFVEVTDSRTGSVGEAQHVRSPEYQVTFANAEALNIERTRRHEQLTARVEELLAIQLRLRVETDRCETVFEQLDVLLRHASDLHVGQVAMENLLGVLIEDFPFTDQQRGARQALEGLLAGPAPQAAAYARELASIITFDDRVGPCRNLAETQDLIIQQLQALLAVTTTEGASGRQTGHGDEAVDGEDTDPQAFQDNVASLADAQSRIVQAANDLAQQARDSDQISPQARDNLQAMQDQLSAFLDDLKDQARRLPDQDYPADAILHELLAIESDVTMAAHALDLEAIDLAAGLEANALERTDALETDLEKWLTDQPDRVAISMTPDPDIESIDPGDLPDSLEDIIGELLEHEEDLFDAIEDMTSAAATNSAEGMGWASEDGPISSMTGEGVTGNTLPNDNEIGGRGGDGRAGQASGEFIEDVAQGAEGRRTGTRMTDDPIQDASLDDSDPTATSGATGGGRQSGAGGAGLEGSTAQRERLDAILEQQAVLIDRARQAQQWAQDDLVRMQLLSAIALMDTVHDDLGQYRYENALRHREATLNALAQSHSALTGTEVVFDASTDLPADEELEIRSLDEPDLPDAYRQQLRAYYRRLSRRDGEP
jgi:hypothetical protein